MLKRKPRNESGRTLLASCASLLNDFDAASIRLIQCDVRSASAQSASSRGLSVWTFTRWDFETQLMKEARAAKLIAWKQCSAWIEQKLRDDPSQVEALTNAVRRMFWTSISVNGIAEHIANRKDSTPKEKD